MGPARAGNWREQALAILIAGLLTLAWTIADWARLSALILPDPDDMMRLAQIRDWISGQAFGNVTQYRLGSGLAMHWSRLPDLVPAALIVGLEPISGRHGAELVAVIAWPAMLFAATLTLLAGIARRLSGQAQAGIVALLLGALAYPATGVFMPGRIDHHGLQLVLLLVAVRAMIAAPSARAGGVAGLAIAASLAIGLESAPLCALVLASLALRWALGGEGRAVIAAGVALASGTAATALVLAPGVWPASLCDTFTPPVAWLTMLAGVLLALAGAIPGSRASAGRLAALAAAGIMLVTAAPWLAPACLAGPYGAVSPLLRTLWLDHVAEAQPLLKTPMAVVIGYAGLMLAGMAAATLNAWRNPRDAAALAWAGLLIGAFLLSCIQLRLAPFGAALAVPVLAYAVVRTRARGRPLATAAAWAASAGILYPLAASALPVTSPPEPARAPCLTRANLGRIAALGHGIVAVPLDMGVYVLATSSHRVLAAPYHRNGDATQVRPGQTGRTGRLRRARHR
ncbi:hypothetical protein [Sphingomonas turrisvirgatae]|uniref:Glycosyltransferase RgtA/B/C/D-like domain-containing protein n=1 Tax=Sphingomonas turrisvirgatae TaxID=1888892 RepID=A0A1E3M102_9SPHN|nr:hypothetical protein [Sphingomonas turrisvirgatae]ODP39641.1 hypothetical protein BFL28_08355 [Sphingomonas turrisvirgatae]